MPSDILADFQNDPLFKSPSPKKKKKQWLEY